MTRTKTLPVVPVRPRLAPVKAEARRIGIPYTSFRDLIGRGEIAIVRIGRAQYVEPSDVDRWIESRKERG